MPAGRQRWWSNDDLALFHRARSVLEKAGLSTETDGGVTDEGEPWLVFSDAESDEVIAHVAHISGTYVVWAPILSGALTGSDGGMTMTGITTTGDQPCGVCLYGP